MQFPALAFLCGVLITLQLTALPDVSWTFLLFLVPPAVIWLKPWRPVWFFAAGLLWSVLIAHGILEKGLAPDWQGKDLKVSGTVVSIPVRQAHRTRFEFELESVDRVDDGKHSQPGRARYKVLVNWYRNAPAIHVGEHWQLQLRMKLPHGFMNPGGFDYEAWLFQKRIRATAYVVSSPRSDHDSGPINQKLPLISPHTRYWIDQQRERLGVDIDHSLQTDPLREDSVKETGTKRESFAGMVKALAIGDRQGISDEQWQVLLVTGTNHLMAISGLHIGLIAGLVFFLVRWLWSRSGRAVLWLAAPKAAAMAALLAALVYAAMAGFAIPTQRALVMVSVIMLAVLWQRQVRPTQVLSLALLIVLLIDPFAVMASGFWLSFAAVSVILYGVAGRSPLRQEHGGRVYRVWWQWGRVQWLLLIGLAPLVLFYYHRVSFISPLANMIAVPWVSFVTVPLSLLGTALIEFWPWAGKSLLQLADISLAGVWPILERMSSWTISQWTYPSPPTWTLFTSLVGCLWLLAPKGFPARWLGIIWLLPLAWLPQHLIPVNEFDFSLLDVGQGLAAVVQTRNHVLVYDTGPRFSEDFDTGDAVVLPYLKYLGINKVDMLVVSHADNDHIGGADSLAEQLPIENVISSVPEKLNSMSARECQEGMQWNWDGVQFELLHPDQDAFIHSKRGNNRSCVLRVSVGQSAVLLPGDIESSAEHYLVSKAREKLFNIEADILVAPHHGSLTSSSEEFIQAVKPHYVLFPVGYRNRYGFPKPTIVERYLQYGTVAQRQSVTLFDTAQYGAISFRLTQEGRVHLLQTYRQAAQRFWHVEG